MNEQLANIPIKRDEYRLILDINGNTFNNKTWTVDAAKRISYMTN